MDMWERYYKDSSVIDKFYEEINDQNYQNVLNNLYQFMKEISYNYFNNNEIIRHYYFLRTEMILVEKKIKNIKLINCNSRYCNLDQNDFIEYLIFKTREYLLKTKKMYTKNQEINADVFNSLDLSNDCKKSSIFIDEFCKKNNIESHIITIYPGYNKHANLYDGNGYHYANIIKYNNEYYLIDTTYSQFFYANRNILSRIGIMGTGGCYCGIFMTLEEDRNKIANSLISNGYIKLDGNILKAYLDAFTISFRNGLYYEETNDYSFITNYSIEDYVKFLNGEDNQLNHEDKIYLGYQSKPLKNKLLCLKYI